MNSRKLFTPQIRRRILISNDFRDVLITQETSIIEQRIITVILSAIKDDQSLFIKRKNELPLSTKKQLSFDDYFNGWANQGEVEFIISFEQLNPSKKMKNASIQNALINMTNINWLRLKDETINGFRAVPFILQPSWNSKNIFFRMDKAVLEHLMNVNPYFSLKNDLPFKVASSNTLRFLLWLSKFKKQGFVVKEYNEILRELGIPKTKYEGYYRFVRDFLTSVKADLDSYNEISFNHNFCKGKFTFVIYDTKFSVGKNEKHETTNDLRISRSVKYLKKKRDLSENELIIIKRLYQSKGYAEMAERLKCKINKNLKGADFVKEIFLLFDKS